MIYSQTETRFGGRVTGLSSNVPFLQQAISCGDALHIVNFSSLRKKCQKNTSGACSNIICFVSIFLIFVKKLKFKSVQAK